MSVLWLARLLWLTLAGAMVLRTLATFRKAERDASRLSWLRDVMIEARASIVLSTQLRVAAGAAWSLFAWLVAPWLAPPTPIDFAPVCLVLMRPYLRARHVLAAMRNSVRLFADGDFPRPFVLYLRDSVEERRTIVAGPPENQTVTHSQPGATWTTRALNGVPMYGLWDATDDRSSLPFEPVLSDGGGWRARVLHLARMADLIVLDVANGTPSLSWEAERVGAEPALLARTLVLRAEGDKDLAPDLEERLSTTGWTVMLPPRSEPGARGSPELPDGARALLAAHRRVPPPRAWSSARS